MGILSWMANAAHGVRNIVNKGKRARRIEWLEWNLERLVEKEARVLERAAYAEYFWDLAAGNPPWFLEEVMKYEKNPGLEPAIPSQLEEAKRLFTTYIHERAAYNVFKLHGLVDVYAQGAGKYPSLTDKLAGYSTKGDAYAIARAAQENLENMLETAPRVTLTRPDESALEEELRRSLTAYYAGRFDEKHEGEEIDEAAREAFIQEKVTESMRRIRDVYAASKDEKIPLYNIFQRIIARRDVDEKGKVLLFYAALSNRAEKGISAKELTEGLKRIITYVKKREDHASMRMLKPLLEVTYERGGVNEDPSITIHVPGLTHVVPEAYGKARAEYVTIEANVTREERKEVKITVPHPIVQKMRDELFPAYREKGVKTLEEALQPSGVGEAGEEVRGEAGEPAAHAAEEGKASSAA